MKVIFPLGVKFLLVLALFSTDLLAIERTQVIKLQKGWNAVHLQVDSEGRKLDEVFEGTPIDLVATYYYKLSSADFIQNTSEIEWNKPSWSKWIAPDRPDSFLANLSELRAGRGYLVHSSKAYEWSYTGTVRLYKQEWEPNSFTLTGLPVSSISPSVSQLMDLSSAHKNQPIYKLVNKDDVAKWQQVTDRVSTEIKQGESYWIYTDQGGQYFTGAIEVKISDTHHVDSVDFLDVINIKRITLKNVSGEDRQVSIDLVDNQIPLVVIDKDEVTDDNIFRPVTGSLFPESLTIKSGSEFELAIQVDRKEIAPNTLVEGLIRVTDDVGGNSSGGEYWIPVSASGVLQ